jgi:hypothetical protein
LCPWERHFTLISSLHPSVKWVPGYRQWKILSECECLSALMAAALRRLWNVIRSAGVIIVKRFENATAL